MLDMPFIILAMGLVIGFIYGFGPLVLKNWPSFTISKDGLMYLTRYYVFLKDRQFGNVFVHHFWRSDMDLGTGGFGLLHNHPFNWSVSFVLKGGYKEERRAADGTVYTKIVKPFSFNWITKDVFHRVDLLDENEGCWSIFLTGSRRGNTWGFWDRVTKAFIPFNTVAGAIE